MSIAKFVMELDLSHNHVSSIDLAIFYSTFDLQISTEKELEKFAGLPVERFFFEGNPVVESFTQRAAYIRLHYLNDFQIFYLNFIVFSSLFPILLCSLTPNLPLQLYSSIIPAMQHAGKLFNIEPSSHLGMKLLSGRSRSAAAGCWTGSRYS